MHLRKASIQCMHERSSNAATALIAARFRREAEAYQHPLSAQFPG
jgi:hypothetical protein